MALAAFVSTDMFAHTLLFGFNHTGRCTTLAFNEFAGTHELFASKYILSDNKAWALDF
jgi:hypothetical protein